MHSTVTEACNDVRHLFRSHRYRDIIDMRIRHRSPAMIRTLAVLASLCVAAPVSAQEKPITVRFHGQSFFEIVSPQGVRIVLDPHAIEAYGRKQVEADLVLMSHFHNDHTQLD